MKSYLEVVRERYDGKEKNVHLYDNIYSLINPVGFYTDKKIRTVFYSAFNFIRNNGRDITGLSILDIGCGKGSTTRFFSELTGKPENIYGMDLSENRIHNARELNPKINYVQGDLINPPSFPVKFEIITALDVFMHLNGKDELLSALNNVKNLMTDDGYFIWYDAYSHDHFKTNPDQDHSGFHPKQMIQLAEEAGFKKVLRINIFKRLFWKYHSAYMIRKFPEPLVKIMENIFPGTPGNAMMIFVKN